MPPSSARLPHAVLFDLDGTLVDTFRLYVECYRRALAPYLSRVPDEAEIVARRPASERRFLADWIGERYAEDCHAAMLRHYAALHASLGEGEYDGVREMLAALRSAGIPLGIVTGKSRAAWEVTEAALGLGPFAAVVTDDDVAAPKPDPQGILLALGEMGVDPSRAVYVGDGLGDLRAGRDAGTRVAAALWPKTGEGEADAFAEEIRPLAPDWTFARPADVTRAFAPWC
ncbi:MAG TPA: HAD-IA family hydrolase [Longimicrobiaceae bacterium]|nr:HAD-IA family hydrolase [Longimicrobiaceae bacterium]